VLGAAALVTSLAACSSGPQGIVVNLYGGASESGFDEIIAACNEQAAGRYTIVGNLLPSATSSCAGSPRGTPAWTCSAWT
jgi:multiple sugar transport system substrate-binding protein